MAIDKFLSILVEWKAHEWTDVKELMPLQFVPYVAKLFREVTGKVHWLDRPRGLLSLESSPARPASSHPLPPRPADAEDT